MYYTKMLICPHFPKVPFLLHINFGAGFAIHTLIFNFVLSLHYCFTNFSSAEHAKHVYIPIDSKSGCSHKCFDAGADKEIS